ncbi:MAG: ParB/RepB/Spo0J family partition protein [Deltaproteobacteria bacterium]|nr:MAG: ParB/RepB/Spo0J family partition protein [Deltaproteobacteria bacterium]
MTPPPSKPRPALGRGLSALIPDAPSARDIARRDYLSAPIEDVHPAPDQPRRRFDDAALDELARSIAQHGIIQPLIVRQRPAGGYTLIAGERRWRAAQRAGLREVPVVIQKVSDRDAFERALVENLQRADLNPIEEAEAYRRLASDYGYTQDQIAERVGKDRSTVANALRLLKLPPRVREAVESGALTMGHARALLALEDPAAIETAARTVVARKLSVRATEALARKRRADKPAAARDAKPANLRDLETRLARALGCKVAVTPAANGTSGRLEIRYQTLDDLDRVLDRLLAPR